MPWKAATATWQFWSSLQNWKKFELFALANSSQACRMFTVKKYLIFLLNFGLPWEKMGMFFLSKLVTFNQNNQKKILRESELFWGFLPFFHQGEKILVLSCCETVPFPLFFSSFHSLNQKTQLPQSQTASFILWIIWPLQDLFPKTDVIPIQGACKTWISEWVRLVGTTVGHLV